jgi:hypothetical protein
MADLICKTKCFVHARLYRPGDVMDESYREEGKEYKHFYEKGKTFVEEPVPLVAGDDIRPTEEIAVACELRGVKFSAKARKTRKKVFAKWIEVKDDPIIGEAKANKTTGSKPTKPTTPHPDEQVTRPATKSLPLSKLSPDAIDGLKPKELGQMYGIPWQGRSKEKLIEEILAKEEKV